MRTRILRTRNSFWRVVCATLLTAAAIVAAAPLSAAPGKQVPFSASFDVVFQSSFSFPIISVSVQGQGHATHMGRSETFTTDQEVSVLTSHGTATYTVIAANGDTIEFFDEIDEVLDGQSITFEGTYTVVGGTGRFAGATGSGTVIGSAQFAAPGATNGVGEFTFDGTISSPGKK